VAGRIGERRGCCFATLGVTNRLPHGTLVGVPFDTTFRSVTAREIVEAPPAAPPALPGSKGEHLLQCAYGTEARAARFYADQVRDRLLPVMVEFVGRMEMMFVATSDSHGDCDCSLRAGPPGFIQVLDDGHLAYPEYRGNGVHASLGNISENPHVGLLMIDFERDLIGLHVNGRARVVEDAKLRALHPALPVDPAPGRRAEHWVVIAVDEAYIHCRKHIPRMARVSERRDWGTDDPARKGGDYFGARAERLARDDAALNGAHSNGVPGGVPGRVPGAAASAPPPAVPSARPGSGMSTVRPAVPSSGIPVDRGSSPVAPLVPPARPEPRPESRPVFPSTTHLPAGTSTARPLRARWSVSRGNGPRRRIRWLSS